METRCVRCDAPLECLASSECWCMKLPPGLPVPAEQNSGCYCPNCLAAVMAPVSADAIQSDTTTETGNKLTDKPR
ncbi:hypothetical protein LWC05_04750 [Acetobacter sicerae]|uniref:Cysteine-rich CWC n=1 Tax=Acetobacter sicerae TaxID=85325 RepID=A0ABS8VST9_9PROT|nr:hypothetical protein [Acetobacter sicerae]MCE0743201.1 hypothetical protein [Acetobacter sicerae]NHN92622.1 hypothetical protein [Acetobacter sicerae]